MFIAPPTPKLCPHGRMGEHFQIEDRTVLTDAIRPYGAVAAKTHTALDEPFKAQLDML